MASITVTVQGVPDTGTPPLNVYFASFVSGGTGPYTYAWVFGDGGTASTQNAVHTYQQNGTFTAQCTVTDMFGNVALSQPIQVLVSAVVPPATFTILPTQVCVASLPAPLLQTTSGPGLEAVQSGAALEDVPGAYYDTCLGEFIGTAISPDTVAFVASLVAGDSTLTISPNTGSVVAALNLGNANTWSALQTFTQGITGSGTTGSLAPGAGLLGTASTWTAPQNFSSGLTLGGNIGGNPTFTGNPSFSGVPVFTDPAALLKAAGLWWVLSGVALSSNQNLQYVYSSQITMIGTDGSSHLALDPNGSFGGVSTGSPLVVNGGVTCGNLTASGGSATLGSAAAQAGLLWFSAAGALRFEDETATDLAMALFTGAVTISAGYTLSVAATSNTSDSRAKPDFGVYGADPLEELGSVRFGRYSRMGGADLGSWRAGVAAETLPETVRVQQPDGLYAIRQPDGFAWLVGVVQALATEVDRLRKAS